MHWHNWFKLIGIVLLAWIVSSVNWGQAIQALVRLDPLFVVAYVGCFVAMMLVRTIRLRLALSRLDHHLSFGACYVATLEPAFMGAVTPGRLGEFTRVGYIHGHGVPMTEAISVVAVERLIDVYVLLTFGVGGMVYIFTPGTNLLNSGGAVMVGLLLFLGAIRGYSSICQLLQKHLRWLARLEPAAFTLHRQGMATSLQLVMRQAATPVFVLGMVCIALNFMQVYFLAKAFGFQADYMVVMFAYAAATLVSLLPISVGGVGTREATYIMIMAREGIMKEQALLFSLLDGVVLGIFGLFLLIIPIWVLRDKK